jgi:hypothetical protein
MDIKAWMESGQAAKKHTADLSIPTTIDLWRGRNRNLEKRLKSQLKLKSYLEEEKKAKLIGLRFGLHKIENSYIYQFLPDQVL